MTDITELAQLRAELLSPAIGSNAHLRKIALSLVEALEKAQQQIVELQQGCENDPRIHEIIDLKERIAELESRTVKLPDLRQIVSGDRYVWSDGVYNYSQDVKVALAAVGIKVEAE
ncbi:hypothetical protein U4Q01_06490 [Klebsiella pneumoniae]|nr:hypothetical protein [Klebsiella pneumoniae]MCT8903979.1 hypothetical protein [Klebsiella pneumoniae]